jgi:heme-degrading monooxygenase HmoA
VITIGMDYRVRPGKEEAFEAAFRRVLEAVRAAEGHSESRLYRELGSERPAYLIVSRWTSEEAFRAFVASKTFAKVTDWGRDHVLEGPPRHTTYREEAT